MSLLNADIHNYFWGKLAHFCRKQSFTSRNDSVCVSSIEYGMLAKLQIKVTPFKSLIIFVNLHINQLLNAFVVI